MSGHDADDERGSSGENMISGSDEALDRLTEGVNGHLPENLSEEGISEEMAEAIKRWESEEGMNWDNLEHCADLDDDAFYCDSEDDSLVARISRATVTKIEDTCPETEEDLLLMGPESDCELFGRNFAHRGKGEYEDIMKLTREDLLLNKSIAPSVESMQELIRKFSAIELLRKKEEIANTGGERDDENSGIRPSTGSSNCQSPTVHHILNPEECLRHKRYSKRRCKRTQAQEGTTSDDSARSPPFSEKKDVANGDSDAVRRSSDSSSQEYDTESSCQDREKTEINFSSTSARDIHLKQDVHQNSDEENVPEIENQKSSSLEELLSDWKTDAAGGISAIFDGYEIDCPSSFHDWMVEHVLSREENRSYEEGSSNMCTLCFSFHSYIHDCQNVYESSNIDISED